MAGLWLSGSAEERSGHEGSGASVWLGQLECANCLAETFHEVRYVAGLLHQIECTVCGQRLDADHKRLRELYVRGLPRRLLTKPGRLAREARLNPVGFALRFPLRMLSKPARVAEEAGTVAGLLDE